LNQLMPAIKDLASNYKKTGAASKDDWIFFSLISDL
jgi:hypothetical protein